MYHHIQIAPTTELVRKRRDDEHPCDDCDDSDDSDDDDDDDDDTGKDI